MLKVENSANSHTSVCKGIMKHKHLDADFYIVCQA